MNEPRSEHDRIERLLKQARLPEPSPQLHDRVTAAAKQAWDQEPAEVPWQIPLRRLVLAAAAAFVIISVANHLSDRVTSPNRSYTGPVRSVRNANDDILGAWGEDAPYRWGTIRPGRKLVNGQAVRDRIKNLHQMLDEMNHNGT